MITTLTKIALVFQDFLELFGPSKILTQQYANVNIGDGDLTYLPISSMFWQLSLQKHGEQTEIVQNFERRRGIKRRVP